MSNIAVQGGAGGTGTVTIVAPSTSTDRTLTLPDSTGTLLDSTGSTTLTNLTVTNGASIQGLTVGRGAGAVATNTAVGASALAGSNTGGYNTAVGYLAMAANTTGELNVAVGRIALDANTTGNNNTALGDAALTDNTTGGSNVAVGRQALTANTTASNNVAVGYLALQANTTASENTAVGYQAGYSIVSSPGNVSVGAYAGNNITGQYNTAIGRYAMGDTGAKSGGFNVAIGNGSGGQLTTGEKNTFVGFVSGEYITTGSKNSILGAYNGNQGGLDIRTANNYIVLSDGDGAVRMFASPTYVNLGGAGSADTSLVYSYGTYNYTSGGAANMGINSSGFMYRSTSSLKYKKNVQDATHGLAEVLQLRPVTYESKQEAEAGNVYGGLIAEEVHAAGLTEFVQYADDGTPDALAYGNMVSLCVKAIQELKAEFDAYKEAHP